MKLRNVLLALSLGIILVIPTTVSATEYDTTGQNDELSEEEIEALDTVEDEYDVDDYDYQGEGSELYEEGSTTETNTGDNTTSESEGQSTTEYNESLASEDIDIEDSTEVESAGEESTGVETPKTGDTIMYYVAGLFISTLLCVYLVIHKEKCYEKHKI